MDLIEGLNIEYIHGDGDTLEAKMNLTSFHSQPFGTLHGGATIAFAETVAGYASNQKLGAGQRAVGQTVLANHMKGKRIEGYLLAKGKLLHEGKRSHVWGIEMRDEKDRLISYITVTNAIVDVADQEAGREQ